MSSATPQRTEILAASVFVDAPQSRAAAPIHLTVAPKPTDAGPPGAKSNAGLQRIDEGHVPACDECPTIDANGDECAAPDHQRWWLQLHASDLIDRLQSWASDLDAREARLNARTALQDHFERQFRLQKQHVAAELAEQKRGVERLRRQVEAQARRLAFQQSCDFARRAPVASQQNSG